MSMPLTPSIQAGTLASLLAAALALPAAHAQTDCDQPPFGLSNISVGEGPYRPDVADLDQDGDLDIAVTGGIGVSICLNNGDGTFADTVEYAGGTTPRHLQLGDMNGDTFVDVVIGTTNSSDCNVLLNNGDGTFGAPTSYPCPSNVLWLSLGDVDNDGDLDVVTANNNADSLSVFLNNGAGVLSLHSEINVINGPYSIELADLTGDGLLDIAVSAAVDIAPAGGGETVFILPNLGENDGMWQGFIFVVAPEYIIEVGAAPFEITIAELDGLPGLDIGILNAISDTISVVFNNGDGTFSTDTEYPQPEGHSIAFADIDDDGDNDMLVSRFIAADLDIRRNDGAGNFGPIESVSSGSQSRGLVAADIDGDTDLDVIMADQEGDYVHIVENLGDGELSSGRARYAAGFAPWAIDLGDLNGDGAFDVIATSTGTFAGETPGITVLLNNGDATFGPATHYPETIVPDGVVIADVDGDLDADVVFRSRLDAANERLAIMFNNGDGTLAPPIYIPLLGTYAHGLDLLDLDQDGDPDLVYIFRNDVVNPGGSINSTYFTGFLYNDGTGDFVDSAFIQETPPGWANVYAADFNNDNQRDLLFGGLTNSIGIRLSNGDGTWSNMVKHPAGVFTQDHETFDVDNDGDIDIVTGDRIDSTISVYLNNGDGTFAPRIPYAMPGEPFSLAIGDMDGDGFTDLAAPMYENNIDGDFRKVVVILNDGTGAFVDYLIYESGPSSLQAAVGDLNNDGAPDLAFVDSNQDELSIYLNQCGAAPPCPADCSPDNGDGTVGNGSVNIDDLLAVINEFHATSGNCDVAPANPDGTFGNGAVNIDDLLAVINAFGPCP